MNVYSQTGVASPILPALAASSCVSSHRRPLCWHAVLLCCLRREPCFANWVAGHS